LGLVALVYFSAGPTPEAGEWIRVPDLSFLLGAVLGILVIIGIVITAFVRPKAGERSQSESRTLRSLLVLAIVVGAAAIWFGPTEVAEESPIVEQEQAAAPTSDEPAGSTTADLPAASGTDIAVLGLILLIIGAVVIRRMRSSPPAPREFDEEVTLQEDLKPAVEAAHQHLSEEADPRFAVLMAYSLLESALSDLGHTRDSAETPSEHMTRVLADIPFLRVPAVKLGELYELARFSQEVITEEDRQDATRALDQARSQLADAELSQL
jgi:hypothetical protein